MNTNDVYHGPAWLAYFFDGFHNTTQVITGTTEQEAKSDFEKRTGFTIRQIIKQ